MAVLAHLHSDHLRINSDDDQRQLVEILVLDFLLIKLEYVSQNLHLHLHITYI